MLKSFWKFSIGLETLLEFFSVIESLEKNSLSQDMKLISNHQQHFGDPYGADNTHTWNKTLQL